MKKQVDWNQLPKRVGEPDFNNLLAVLRREVPKRPTLFEFFLNGPLYERLAGGKQAITQGGKGLDLTVLHGFRNAGYDYVTYGVPGFGFPAGEVHRQKTISLNEGFVITDRASFDRYAWPEVSAANYAAVQEIGPLLPKGMQVVLYGPGGVEENVIRLVGYENLCYIMADDEQLACDIFEAVGSRLVGYYERGARLKPVGACISNDDWGFKTGTLLSITQMRKFLFPWHQRIVEAIHAAGKPAILHSCGYFDHIIDDLTALQYDGRHSYEDAILPVEQAYDRYHDRFAILGGIDVDFVCRSKPEEVYRRSKAMIARASKSGGFALGTGNSVPEYVPPAGYLAMIRAALDGR